MDANYWKRRWESRETGWHQKEVEPALVTFFSGLKSSRILVPLCGKSLDLFWLARQGHQVLGVELSETACRSFFEENGIAFEVATKGAFQIFSGAGVDIRCGDFFDLTVEELGAIDAVYDRAALIALPRDLRRRYATHLCRLVAGCANPATFRFLEILLERTPLDENGPPFSVASSELSELYSASFDIQLLSRERVEARSFGASVTEEVVYSLTWN